jgi:hypothetical protein
VNVRQPQLISSLSTALALIALASAELFGRVLTCERPIPSKRGRSCHPRPELLMQLYDQVTGLTAHHAMDHRDRPLLDETTQKRLVFVDVACRVLQGNKRALKSNSENRR